VARQLCVIKKPRGRGGHSPRWAAEPEKIIITIIINTEHDLREHTSVYHKCVETGGGHFERYL
jgi:hypothetical protein